MVQPRWQVFSRISTRFDDSNIFRRLAQIFPLSLWPQAPGTHQFGFGSGFVSILPDQAMSIDISSDSTLLVSASADKNVKVWGLDFGDCHKSMFAHQDSVMQVRFVHDTHYFFSVGMTVLGVNLDLKRLCRKGQVAKILGW